MAAKNSVKLYLPDSYYHIYNRGVEKRSIFQDRQDYSAMLSYLKTYLQPKNEKELLQRLANPNLGYKEKDKIIKELRLNNFYGEISLLSHCLMPNHFHLLIKQKSPNSIDQFMNSIGVRYTGYFNRKYKRVGSLFQDVYKAVLVESDEQLLYLSSYIHQNPKVASQEDVLRAWQAQPSSLPEYLGQRKTEWIHPEEILSFFSKTNPKLSYQNFVNQDNDAFLVNNLIFDL